MIGFQRVRTRFGRLGVVAGLFATTALIATSAPVDAAPTVLGSLAIEVISSDATLVSGGDARVSVDVPKGMSLRRVEFYVDGDPAEVVTEFDQNESRVEAVVSGLPLGESTIEVQAERGDNILTPASIDVTNHPVAGPMFSGPHQEPFYCQTAAAGLGPALDDDCFAETKVEFMYASTQGGFKPLPADAIDGNWQDYKPSQPNYRPSTAPPDMRLTTNSVGKTTYYIVRLETGVINRAVYQTAVLFDPVFAERPDAPSATRGWNGRLVYSYGGGCNAAYAQGTGNGGVLSDLHLSRGYATASSTLNVLNNNCNDVLSAETTSMVKEHFIETYGSDVHTIGWGGSGGAISQHLIAHNYPGLLDGIIPTLPYPDATSIFSGIGDCRLLYNYFNTAPAGLWDADAIDEVSGYHDWTNCLAWEFSFTNRIDATAGCNPIVPPDTIFDPVTNPDGVRCSVADDAVNVLGVDPATGFAPTPADNLGVQYGLTSLNDGDITVEQFLALNAGIGGFDTNGEVVDGRTGPSEMIGRFYETGRITTGAGLATTPIINVRPYLDAVSDIHTRAYTFATNERLLRDNGTADNQVIQIYGLGTPGAVVQQIVVDALADMDEWLDNIESDPLERTAAEVIAAKPAQILDTCWDATGNAIIEPASLDGDTACNALYPSFGDPRVEAGAPSSMDVLSCVLEPLDPADYTVSFTDDEWSELQAAFPTGVCDYTEPGVGQGSWAGPWQRFGGAD